MRARPRILHGRCAALLISVLGGAACASPPTADAAVVATTPPQEAQPAAAKPPGWRFDVEPYVWLPSTSGTGTTDTTPPLEIDLVGTLDAALPLALGARSPDGKYTVLADGFYVRMKDDEGTLQTTTEATMIEAGFGIAVDPERYVTALVGLRYVDIDYEVGFGALTGDASASWVDPWVGARSEIPLNETFAIRLRGDVGGFGVGTDFSWQAMGFLATTIGSSVRIDVGYRAIGLDYEDSGLSYDVVFHGPIVGVGFSF